MNEILETFRFFDSHVLKMSIGGKTFLRSDMALKINSKIYLIFKKLIGVNYFADDPFLTLYNIQWFKNKAFEIYNNLKTNFIKIGLKLFK